MYFQYINSSFQIRFFHDNPSVKTSRTKQCLIQNFRPVCRTKNDDSLGRIKSVHLGKELVQCLLALIIAAAILGITAFSDGIDLIDKNNTWRHLLCLFEKVTDTRSTDTNKHFHKIGT